MQAPLSEKVLVAVARTLFASMDSTEVALLAVLKRAAGECCISVRTDWRQCWLLHLHAHHGAAGELGLATYVGEAAAHHIQTVVKDCPVSGAVPQRLVAL